MYFRYCALVVVLAAACVNGLGGGWDIGVENVLRPISSKWYGSESSEDPNGDGTHSTVHDPATEEDKKEFLVNRLGVTNPQRNQADREAFVDRIYEYDPNPSWHGIAQIHHSDKGEGPPSGSRFNDPSRVKAAEESFTRETDKFLQNHINREASPNTRGWLPWTRSFWSAEEPLGAT
jgi:hypothetical protein